MIACTPADLRSRGRTWLIDKLELLLALAKERHFGRAAEACGVTQPTMSTGLKQLEEILGVMLVQRGSRFQGFTPEGERALDWARRIVGDARAMRDEINGLKHQLSGEIRIAAIPTVLGMVASLTTPFRAQASRGALQHPARRPHPRCWGCSKISRSMRD